MPLALSGSLAAVQFRYPAELSLNLDKIEHFSKASECIQGCLMNQGAFFTRPYGIWADMAFNKDEQSMILLKQIKGILDPNGVMNPGKLCFK